MDELVFKGNNGNLHISEAGVRITRGAKGMLLQGAVRGQKLIPWESIVAVQYKAAGLMGGYLQLSLRGGSEAKHGILEAQRDENTITWSGLKSRNKDFERARDLIQARITFEPSGSKVCPECAEEVKAAANVCRYCGHRFLT